MILFIQKLSKQISIYNIQILQEKNMKIIGDC